MRKLSKKQKVTTAAVTLLALTGTGTLAYAYWTTNGAGTGQAQTGTSTNITLSGVQNGLSSNLTPGGPGVTIDFSAVNPSSGIQHVGTVHLVSVDAYPTALDRTNGTKLLNGTLAGQCDTTKYSLLDVLQNQDIPAGGPTALTTSGLLLLANDPANSQDGCKDAFLTLNLTSN